MILLSANKEFSVFCDAVFRDIQIRLGSCLMDETIDRFFFSSVYYIKFDPWGSYKNTFLQLSLKTLFKLLK